MKAKEIFKKGEHTVKESVEITWDLMEETQFWNIIERSKEISPSNYKKQIVALKQELQKLTALEILTFENRMHTILNKAKEQEVWEAAYIMIGKCNKWQFMIFREWLISLGKSAFYSALAHPDSLVAYDLNITVNQIEAIEGLSFVAVDVYEEKTGGEIPSMMDHINNAINVPLLASELDGVSNRYPKLWAKWKLHKIC